MRGMGVLLRWAVQWAVLLAGMGAWAQVALTTVQGTVYRANGQPASGVLTVSWPAFTTAANQAVAAGSLQITVGADGFASVQLAPNAGATPAGSFYTVVYHLSDGSISREYWTVPTGAKATIAGVRAQLQPAAVAVQSVSKTYVDNLFAQTTPTTANFLPLTGGALSGPLSLGSDPQADTQATTKHYVDQAIAGTLPLSGGVVTGTVAVANQVTKLPRVDVRSVDFAGGADPTGVRDSTAALQAAIAFALGNAPSRDGDYPTVYLPPGHYLVNGTLRVPNLMKLEGDSKAGAILQETNPTASLVTMVFAGQCSTYSCYGGLENLTLEGSGKATMGNLLELDAGFTTLRNLHFFNHGGRGLQMNGPSERVTSYDLSFYQVRWPLIMAGDSNEDYFYNTHVIEAGQTADGGNGNGAVGRYCYSVNCTAGQYTTQGTTTTPAVIYPDPHGSIDIEKAVNVSFVGGSVKSTFMLSGVRVWDASVIRF